ncbi:MAG: UDP-N-acetylglucosamine--N-acetylmuramyl-(pentapeptide) pyrophosphoryl-undecaprenol N-acetylglucosamine transferase, partial [Oscillospiraceae bacterium]|nr:UDP-N-acetylglucosamine--N-acetylmuramyl-(pentapeptide) pyrophosphoryl-undecaprenol N-acetylglucosamine transferase [Oscillospiraceae bacterium]
PDKVVLTGTPVRGEFFRFTRAEARKELGITDDRPLVVSFFGSLGATVMNGYVMLMLSRAIDKGAPFRWIHGGGRNYSSIMAGLDGKSADGIEVREYIYDMPLVMAAADLVICRSGASTISELAAIAKPSILIPSPNVTADHQTKNAKVLSNAGGAVLLPEKECEPEKLYEMVSDLLQSSEKRAEMSRALSRLAIPDANEKIYETLQNLLR